MGNSKWVSFIAYRNEDGVYDLGNGMTISPEVMDKAWKEFNERRESASLTPEPISKYPVVRGTFSFMYDSAGHIIGVSWDGDAVDE